MSNLFPESIPPSNRSDFDSPNCVNLEYDIAEWDTTVRPLRPPLLKRAIAERERLAQVLAQMNQSATVESMPLNAIIQSESHAQEYSQW